LSKLVAYKFLIDESILIDFDITQFAWIFRDLNDSLVLVENLFALNNKMVYCEIRSSNNTSLRYSLIPFVVDASELEETYWLFFT
jgi:hypothetical protein